MRILHTEASPGLGGQELRILAEAVGMRERGHEIFFAVQKGGGLVQAALDEGFEVFELSFAQRRMPLLVKELIDLIRRYRIALINTHSSIDAWSGGLAARVCRKKVIRTRHLSTPIKKGLNSIALYNWLADRVVTTCAEVVPTIRSQAKLAPSRCLSVPTGVTPFAINPSKVESFRGAFGLEKGDIVAGTLCVMRGWKGVKALIDAAHLLRHYKNLKWLIVGDGPSLPYFRQEVLQHKLTNVIFTGHIKPPFEVLALMDIFVLLSWAHEGVSQASLQASDLKKPLVQTPTGGLKEVCIDGKTGLLVPVHAPEMVASSIEKLYLSKELREELGNNAYEHVTKHFMIHHTLDQMEMLTHEV